MNAISRKPGVKLPQLEMPTFDGSHLRWQAFWDRLDSSIHSNEELKRVDKFSYLMSFLSGEAKRCIEGIAITNANYQFAHFQQLINLPVSTNETSKLRWTYDELERNIRCLEALGQQSFQFGVIRSKLSREMVLGLNRKKGSAEWELITLRPKFKQELLARESADQRAPERKKQVSQFDRKATT